MRDHRQGFAVIDGKGRHVVVLKLLMLIISENDHDVRIDLLESVPQRLNGFLARFITLAELFGREFSLEGMLESFTQRKNVTVNLNTPRRV